MRYKARIEISQEIELCLETPLFTGDVGNTIGLEFYLRGKPYEFTTASLFGTNKAGETVFSTAKAEGNMVVLPIVNDMFQVPVKADMQVVLYDDSGNALTSGYLHFTVIQGLSENASVEGTDEYNSLMELLAQVSSGVDQINRAEQAANEIEAFLQMIAEPENSVVHQITESEADTFTQGYAVVSASVTTDSDGGPILTEYKYPLIAESVDTFGSVTVYQLRFYNGKLQQRTDGGEWTEVSCSGSAEIPEGVMTYKGSLENTDSLPENPATGDVYAVTEGGTVPAAVQSTLKLIPVTFVSCEIDYNSSSSAYITYLFDSDSYTLSSGSEYDLYSANPVELKWYLAEFMDYEQGYAIPTITVNGNQIEVYFHVDTYHQPIQTEEQAKEIRYIQIHGAEENGNGEDVTVYETTEIPVAANQKVFYNGSEWDVFVNIGDIETALSNIEALQNSYIDADTV